MMQDKYATLPALTALSFRHAEQGDAGFIADLVNSAYRGDSSRQGKRINTEDQ